MAMGSAPSVGGKRERAEQQGDVVVPLVGDREGHGDLGKEDVLTGRGGVRRDVESQPIGVWFERRREGEPPVLVRRTGREYDVTLVELHRNTLRRPAQCGVEHMSTERTHAS